MYFYLIATALLIFKLRHMSMYYYVNVLMDLYLTLNRLIYPSQILINSDKCIEIIKIAIRFNDGVKYSDVKIDSEQIINLSKYFDIVDQDQPIIVDIEYKIDDCLYMYSTQTSDNKIEFYQNKQIQIANIISIDDIENDIPNKIEMLKLINMYLGPLGDFHGTLNPIKFDWIDWKGLFDGQSLTLTTNLMESIQFEKGKFLSYD